MRATRNEAHACCRWVQRHLDGGAAVLPFNLLGYAARLARKRKTRNSRDLAVRLVAIGYEGP